jgi:hypothetical protein
MLCRIQRFFKVALAVLMVIGTGLVMVRLFIGTVEFNRLVRFIKRHICPFGYYTTIVRML